MLQLHPIYVLSDGEADPIRMHPLVYGAHETMEKINHLPQDAREKAVAQIRKTANMIERIAKTLNIASPLLVLPNDDKSAKFAATRIWNSTLMSQLCFIEGMDLRRGGITIDPRFIDGLGFLSSKGQARLPLCLSDDELYAVLAHEAGHANNYFLQMFPVPRHEASEGISILGLSIGKYDNQPHIDALKSYNHTIEHQMDGAVLAAGGDRKAFIRSLLKATRDKREQLFSGDEDREVRAQRRKEGSDYPLRHGKNTHPSIPDRNEAMRLREQNPQHWRDWLRAKRVQATIDFER